MVIGYYVVEVKEGDMVVVMGDGVVGFCGVIVVKMLGVNCIIVMSCYKDRQELVLIFGVMDIVEEWGDEVVKCVLDLIN